MTDAELQSLLKKLAQQQVLGLMTNEEAEAAYDSAIPEPLSEQTISEMVKRITGNELP